jgi:hypothetical protein
MKNIILQFYEYKPIKILILSTIYALIITTIIYLKIKELNYIAFGSVLILSLLLLFIFRYFTELNRIPLFIIESITKYQKLEDNAIDAAKIFNWFFIII